MKKKLAASIAMAILGTAIVASNSLATPTLNIYSDAGFGVTIADGDALDLSPVVGRVLFDGVVGNWSSNTTTGQSKPFLGSATSPKMDLSSVNTSVGAGVLDMYWTDNDFGPLDTVGFGGFLADFGGTTEGSSILKTYYDDTNALFGMGHMMTESDLFFGGAFSGSEYYSGDDGLPEGMFSLTMHWQIEHLAGGITSGNALLNGPGPAPVPEPATMLLFGTGLVGLAGVARRRKGKK